MHFETAQSTRVPHESLVSARIQQHVQLRKLSDQDASRGFSPQSRGSGSCSTRVSTHLFKAQASYLARKELAEDEEQVEICLEPTNPATNSGHAERSGKERPAKLKFAPEQERSSSESSIEEKDTNLFEEIRQRRLDRVGLSPTTPSKLQANRRLKKQRVAEQLLAPHLSSLEFIHQKLRQQWLE